MWSMRSHKNLVKLGKRDGFSKEEELKPAGPVGSNQVKSNRKDFLDRIDVQTFRGISENYMVQKNCK